MKQSRVVLFPPAAYSKLASPPAAVTSVWAAVVSELMDWTDWFPISNVASSVGSGWGETPLEASTWKVEASPLLADVPELSGAPMKAETTWKLNIEVNLVLANS